MKKVITISRQYGSGGREIGAKLAEKFGIPFYDNELITRAAKESGYAEAAFHNAETKATNSLLYSIAMGMSAYGIGLSAFRRGVLFCLLQGSLWGITGQDSSPGVMLLGALGLSAAAVVAFAGRAGSRRYVPVQLRRGEVKLNLTALEDTGNTLTDPVTGQSVLIVGRKPAMELTGLSQEALADPVGSMGKLPGLRLIPYRSIGKDAGFLLALRLPDVTIGNKRGAALVALSPTNLSMDGGYEALTGGVI